MKKIAAIFLLLLFTAKALTPAFDLACELQKLPNLVEHYEEHKKCTGESLLKFLAVHFINLSAGEKHQDDQNHENLPFHGNHCEHITVLYAFTAKIEIAEPQYTVQTKIGFYDDQYPIGHSTAPFHPPKV